MTAGITAGLALSFAGSGAGDPRAEIDLALGNGGLLTMDPAGDFLIVSGAAVAVGQSAASIFAMVGLSASAAAEDFSGTIEGEGWVGFETEDGQIIVTEGSF